MRRILLFGLFALYAVFVSGVLVVTYQEQTAQKSRSFIDADVGWHVAGGAEEAELADSDHPAPYNGVDPRYDPADPPLVRLLHCSAKYDLRHTTRFFTALSAVFFTNKVPLTDTEPAWGIDEGYAVSVTDGLKKYVVVVLRGWDHMVPGDDTQYLFLLGADGKILDRVSCAVNSRLTRESAGLKAGFRTELVHKREGDGADLIVRYTPPNSESISGNWAHTVVNRGFVHSYPWNEEPNDFEKKGLCRVAIREGRFVVLFPG